MDGWCEEVESKAISTFKKDEVEVKLVNMLNITYLYNEETSQKYQVVTASTPSKPLLT